jgi:nickel transport protein
MIRKQLSAFAFGLIAVSVVHPLPSLAHNTMIEYKVIEAIAIQAKFDNGKPMTNAQVVVYAPDNLSVPWQKGLTDDQGKFTFIPDYDNQGNWTIKVRSAGHGSIINIPIQSLSSSSNIQGSENKESTSISDTGKFSQTLVKTSNSVPLSLTQKLVMAVMGSWGFVGTALFFSRNNKTIN